LNADSIQARQANGSPRPLHEREAIRLLLQALGAFNRQASVHVLNTNIQGQPAALTIIPGIVFEPDDNGKTTIRKVTPL
jgi:hypothetical protein